MAALSVGDRRRRLMDVLLSSLPDDKVNPVTDVLLASAFSSAVKCDKCPLTMQCTLGSGNCVEAACSFMERSISD